MLTKSNRQSKKLAVLNAIYDSKKPDFSAELTLRKEFYNKKSTFRAINH